MKTRLGAIGVFLLLAFAGSSPAAEWFVATNGNDAAEGTNWATAKLTIQAGIDMTASNDTVWVSNGVYAMGGGRVVVGTWPNRVAVDKPVAVRSVNGPETTFIVGAGMRCAYVTNGATLSGFTLTNGVTAPFNHEDNAYTNVDYKGGGAFCEDSAVLSNCVLTGNSAFYSGGGSWVGVLDNCTLIGNRTGNLGGGSYGGTLNQCVLANNSADMSGGGASGSTLNNCLLTGNSAYYGAGASGSTLNNCTVAGNLGTEGGGVLWSTLKNCIVYGNTGDGDWSNHKECTFTNSCTTPLPGGPGNIGVDPRYRDAGAGDYRLQTNSPCIDAGNNGDVVGTTDLDGNRRIASGTVDMGAFEFQPSLEIWPARTNLFGAAASGLAIEVLASVPWTATTNADWIAITSGELGTTNGTVVFAVASNSSAAARTGAVLVAGGGLVRTCAVIQAATGPFMALGPEQFVLSGDAASGLNLAVTANVAWTAATNVPWLTITAGASGISNGTVAFSVASNGLAQPRAGAIQVSGDGIARTCMVVQAEGGAFAADWHVATNGNDAYDGRTWTMAKRTIQTAVDAATNGSTVWVSNGVYVGLVTVNKGVTVKSMNGAEATTIQGSSSRCVNLSNAAAVVAGFTLTGGTADWGAGAYVAAGVLECCIIRDNEAFGVTQSSSDEWGHHEVRRNTSRGGGVYGGALRNCQIFNNAASSYEQNGAEAYGGGTFGSDLQNCLVRNNHTSAFTPMGSGTSTGGGCYGGTLRNCTISENQTWAAESASGGGCHASVVLNSIVKDNTSKSTFGGTQTSNIEGGSARHTCSPGLSSGDGNISDDPLFMAPGSDDYRLQMNSPCIDAGNNADVAGATDLDGNPRIMNASVDMGAFEYFQTTWFVATNGNDAADGTTWAKAKATIQAAVDVAPAGKIVAVSNGVYATGGRAIGSGMTNRVAIDKPLTVRSVNGPGTTSIHGAGPCGPAAVRCAYVGTNAVLSGFTLTNGATRTSGDSFRDQSGGGAWGEPAGVVTNCILTGNMAARYGGGAQGGTLNNCVLTGNRAEWSGGGSSGSTLNQCTVAGNSAYSGGGTYGGTINRGTLTGNQADWSGGGSLEGTRNNCLLAGNSAVYGGGAHDGTLNNCTVAGNSANYGGGSYVGTLNNCIVYSNTAPSGPNFKSSAFNTSCTSPDPGGTANIVDEPQFVDAAAGDYHLRPSSPCINHGAGAAVQGAADLDGNPRIVGGSLDLGAYESQLRGYCAWIGAVTNGLTNDTDCAAGDGMPNLLKYATGGSPREPDDLALLSWVLSNGVPVLVFHRNPEATDVELLIQGADAISDEAEWRGLATNRNGSWGGSTNVEETGTGNPVECTVTDPVALQSNRFLRLRVSRP